MEKLTPVIVQALNDIVAPLGILARNDPRARVLEGLEQRVEVLSGDVPETVTVQELGIEYDVDVWRGQKTGLFLDQRENREAAARYAHGRVLDCFSYNGGFALKLASKATSTTAFDISEEAVARVQRNAAHNKIVNRCACRQRLRRAPRARAAAGTLRHDRARSARVREEPGRRRKSDGRLQGNQSCVR